MLIGTANAVEDLVQVFVCDTAEKVCFFTFQFEPNEAIGDESESRAFHRTNRFRIHRDLPSEAAKQNISGSVKSHLIGDTQGKIPRIAENKSDHQQLTDGPTET